MTTMTPRTTAAAAAAFAVSLDYIEWAHGAAAGDGQPLALRLFEQPQRAGRASITDPRLVAEIADVAELFIGGRDNDLRAAAVRARAIKWLRARGLTVRAALQAPEAADASAGAGAFIGPSRRFFPELRNIGCTGANPVPGLRIDDGFYAADAGCLDATHWLPTGSHYGHAWRNQVQALAAMPRP